MIKKIEEEKKNMIEIRITQRAYEKLEILNGSKEEVNNFLGKITKEGIKKEEYNLFLKDIKEEFYYKKCNKIYVIFAIGEKAVTLVDFLTETEFNESQLKK